MTQNISAAKNTGAKRISGLHEIADNYDLVLCDVWGVLHNGVKAWPEAIKALSNYKKSGGTVVMVTNAPRPRGPVFDQLSYFGVPDGVYDQVVTSGDVTRDLIEQLPKQIYFIGPEKDLNLFDGLDVEFVDENEAQSIVCTGLWNDREEDMDDYRDLLQRLSERDLPMVCANPDIVVEVGNKLIYCAGAIAREYVRLGGKSRVAGKPFAPIYQAAIREAEAISGRKFEKKDILAIGDGILTDIKGAQDFGLDVLFISAGIHGGEYGPADDPDDKRVQEFLTNIGATPFAYSPRLIW